MCVTKFTVEIFERLVLNGYQYCYSKTQTIPQEKNRVIITLTPVIKKPDFRRLPEAFDACFDLNAEPRRMAEGIDGNTFVFIDLRDLILE